MNWDAIGAIGDMVAAAAVVVSLLYLAIQVRTQNREIRVSAIHEILEPYRNVAIPFQSTEHARLFVKGNQDFEYLEEWEPIQIFAIILPVLRLWEEAFHQNQSGRFDDVMWHTLSKLFADFFAASAV